MKKIIASEERYLKIDPLTPEKIEEIISNSTPELRTWLPCDRMTTIYSAKIRAYKENEKFFSKEGLTFALCDKIVTIGFINPWDAYYLFYYGKRVPNGGTYLEIGSHVGGSLLCIFFASQTGDSSVNFIAIDPFIWKQGCQFYKNTEPIFPLTLIKSTSDLAKDKVNDDSIDLLFIDGNHLYEQVKRDIQNYWPKIKIGGTLLGHDYYPKAPQVKRVVNELFGRKGFTHLENSYLFMVKKKNKEIERIEND